MDALEKRLPHARWAITEVTFLAAHTDKVIPHKLRPQQPHHVRFEILDANSPGRLYRGSKLPGDDYIVLRSSEVGTYRIRLFIEAHAGETKPLISTDLSGFTPDPGLPDNIAFTDEANVFTQVNQFEGLDLDDNKKIRLGTGDDAAIYYDGTDLVVDSAVAGSGVLSLLQGRLKFPASPNVSSDANTLDDYEEGTWTPIIGGTTGQSGQAYSAREGYYIKIGQYVFLFFDATLSTVGTITGSLVIRDLPFTSRVSGGAAGSMLIGTFTSLNTNVVYLGGLVPNNRLYCLVQATTAAAASSSNLTSAAVKAGTRLAGVIVYQAED